MPVVVIVFTDDFLSLSFVLQRKGQALKSKETPQAKTQPHLQAFIEKRQDLRNPLIVLEVKWKKYDQIFLGSAKNISLGGLFLSTDRSLRVGDHFPLEFILPGGSTKVVCTGEVSWTRQYSPGNAASQGVGLRFVGLDDRKMKAIEKWIKKQQTQPKKKR